MVCLDLEEMLYKWLRIDGRRLRHLDGPDEGGAEGLDAGEAVLEELEGGGLGQEHEEAVEGLDEEGVGMWIQEL